MCYKLYLYNCCQWPQVSDYIWFPFMISLVQRIPYDLDTISMYNSSSSNLLLNCAILEWQPFDTLLRLTAACTVSTSMWRWLSVFLWGYRTTSRFNNLAPLNRVHTNTAYSISMIFMMHLCDSYQWPPHHIMHTLILYIHLQIIKSIIILLDS